MAFEDELWETAVKLRGSVESAEYKHLVLGLLFLKYISDSFERQRGKLDEATRDPNSDLFTEDDEEREEILEDRDEYIQENVFWVPEDARFERLVADANQPDIGQRIDKALDEIERDNPEQLRGVLPKVYGRSELEPSKLGELINVIARVGFGDDEEKARDLLGRTYEYFIKMFAKAEGARGGEFYTPQSVVQLLVEMLEPFEGRVFDPACGSCGLFIQSARFVEAHGGRARDISIYGQELSHTTGRIGRMNLAIHGLGGQIKIGQSTLTSDQHAGLRADYVLANPPFNLEDWGAEQVADDPRWKYGLPPNGNANYAWIQHFIHHLAPDGRAGFVMHNGALGSRKEGEGDIRAEIVRSGVVDAIVMCPGELFFTTQIPVSLWFIDMSKPSTERRTQVLFIDARKLGRRLTTTQKELTPEDIDTVARNYHSWRETSDTEACSIPGLSRCVPLDEIAKFGFDLSPARYVKQSGAITTEAELKAELQRLNEQAAGYRQVAHRALEPIERHLRKLIDGP